MATEGINSASDIQMNYMTLLVTQLQNQNPLEPMDNQEMAAQLAQFSQLQQLETLNNSFSQVLKSVQYDYASSLLGKQVSYQTTAADGDTITVNGKVSAVGTGSEGEITLTIDDQIVNLSDVTSIRD
jgi:flagellar basal-body rod modification protein FlgD